MVGDSPGPWEIQRERLHSGIHREELEDLHNWYLHLLTENRSFRMVWNDLDRRHGNVSGKDIDAWYRRLLTKERFFQNVWDEMVKGRETEPPFISNSHSEYLERYRNVADIEYTEDVEYGRLGFDDDGNFVPRINDTNPHPRVRSTKAHEIGHTYQFDLDGSGSGREDDKPENLFPNKVERWAFGGESYDVYEWFATEVGNYILVPSPALEKHAPDSASLSLFFDLSDGFDVSRDMMAQRLFRDYHNWRQAESYWNDAMMILYLVEEDSSELSSPPAPQVFAGSSWHKQYDEIWPQIAPLGEYATEKEGRTVHTEELDMTIDTGNSEGDIIAEAAYTPPEETTVDGLMYYDAEDIEVYEEHEGGRIYFLVRPRENQEITAF